MVGAEGGNASKAKLKEELREKFPSVGSGRVEARRDNKRRELTEEYQKTGGHFQSGPPT